MRHRRLKGYYIYMYYVSWCGHGNGVNIPSSNEWKVETNNSAKQGFNYTDI